MPACFYNKTIDITAGLKRTLYDLSNSFCILSQNKPVDKIDKSVLFAFYRTDLKKEYCKQTLFKQDGDDVKVVRNFLSNVKPGNGGVFSFEQEEPVYSGVLHHYRLVEIINRDHWRIEQMGEWLATWFSCLKKELRKQFGFSDADLLRNDLKIKSRYIDALPINLLLQENDYRFIDLELNLQKDIELGYIIFCAVYVSLSRLSSVAPPADKKFIEAENIMYAMFAQLGMSLNTELLDAYYKYEAYLVNNVAPVQIATMKGAVSRLRVRPVITELNDSQTHIQSLQSTVNNLNEHVRGLNHEIHSLSTSRKRMIKQFIKRTLPFLNSYL
jgi:hypothetical protein